MSDIKAAGGEAGTVRFILLDGHRRRTAQRILDAVEVEIIQLLA